MSKCKEAISNWKAVKQSIGVLRPGWVYLAEQTKRPDLSGAYRKKCVDLYKTIYNK